MNKVRVGGSSLYSLLGPGLTYIALILGLSGDQSLRNAAICEESVGVCVYVVAGRTKVPLFFS